jgi:hypothetical protein
MESKVSFEEILDAFLSGNNESYSFLMQNSILKCALPTKEQISELKDKGILAIPKKSREFDKKIREKFIYEIQDKTVAEEAFNAVMSDNTALFEKLLSEKDLTELFKRHEKKISKDALINWLLKSGIALPGQELNPKIDVNEIEPKEVPEEMKSLMPISCNNCSNNIGFTPQYFKTTLPCDNLLMEERAKTILSEKGFENFNFLGRERKELISAATCPRCKGSDLSWDFK